MKKIFTSALALAFLIVEADGQTGLSYSVTVTPQLSFLQMRDNERGAECKRPVKVGFGIGAAYNITNSFGVGADVVYSLQGQRYKLAGKEYNQKSNYIKVPVYFIYNSRPSKEVSFIAKIGEQISFVTKTTLDDKDGNKIDGNSKGYRQTAIFGAMASAGTQWKVKNNIFLTTALRFGYDFNNAEDRFWSGYAYESASTYMTTGIEVGLRVIAK